MNTLFTKFKTLFLENKRILIPFIPLFLFILFFITLVSFVAFSPQQTTPDGQTVPIPTKTNENSSPSLSQSPKATQEETLHQDIDGDESIYDNNPNLEKKEQLPNGTLKYSLTSETTGRPNIVIVRATNQDIAFERTVISQNAKPIVLSDYLEFFGQPERIIKGSRFYGANAQTYIYAKTRGTAFIVNPQTNRVLELQTFAPMSIENYIQKFGDDLIQ